MHHVASRNNGKSISLTRAIEFTSTQERVLDFLETPLWGDGKNQTPCLDNLLITKVSTWSKEAHCYNS